MAQPQASTLPFTRIHVKNLTLSHFRNYISARIDVDERPVVLVGPNGAGKTNILEAISLLTPGRGLRRATIADMDRQDGAGRWAVAATIHGARGISDIGTGRVAQNSFLSGEGRVREDESDNAVSLAPALSSGETDKRIVKIDGKTTRGQTGLTKIFAALWLTPQMDTLFLEGGTARRKFLDRLVYSFDAEHASRVNAYEFAMRERNRLLAMGQSDDRWLAALEQKMAEQGVAIAAARVHAVEGLTQAMMLARHSFPHATLVLSGTVEDALTQGSALLAEESLRAALAASRVRDAGTGRAFVGAHRTSVDVAHKEKNMAAELCSTGEQKALLVSIILAQARAGAAWHGSVPVLLLDEVATHLDSKRRAELYAEIAEVGAQAWITGTDREIFKEFQGQFLNIDSGRIIPSS